jgi:uncharacterized protein with PIN domain
MADRIRFHLDEHVDPAIATALRRAGIDATTTNEAGLRTQDDVAHLRFARDEGRVIVTRDQDFLRLASEGWIILASFSTPLINRSERSSKDLFLFTKC